MRIRSFTDFVSQAYGWLAVGALCLFIFLLLMQWKREKRNVAKLALIEGLVARIQPAAGLESNLNLVLESISSVIRAPAYGFYVLEDRKRQFVLRAVRHREGEIERIGPSYSGLVAGGKETYQPAVHLSVEACPPLTGLIREGEVPLVAVPLEGGRGLLRIGPVSKLRSNQKRLLEEAVRSLSQLLDLLIETERIKLRAEVVITSGRALHKIGAISHDSEAIMEKLLRMSSLALGLDAGLIAVVHEEGIQADACFGLTREAEQGVKTDSGWLSDLTDWLGHRDQVVLQPGDPRPHRMPPALGGSRTEHIAVQRFDAAGRTAVLLCAADVSSDAPLTPGQLQYCAASIASGISELVKVQAKTKNMFRSSAELLITLSRSSDNLNPYTVGYSEQMSRYAIIVAQELGLPPAQIQSIALAAFLSNIGVLGLSDGLLLKDGKYSEIEFEKMKLHAEVGASIVEMTLGDKEVASSIRHHHERMDGNGYPFGLSGDDIPVGARIIAVVQMFLAQLNGRRYRDPLSFDDAVQSMRAAAGAQLDVRVVEAFENWIRNKRADSLTTGRSLGSCWEMCCTPSKICKDCPAYGRTDVNCWELGGNHCGYHGKTCETCFVRTEYLSRSRQVPSVPDEQPGGTEWSSESRRERFRHIGSFAVYYGHGGAEQLSRYSLAVVEPAGHTSETLNTLRMAGTMTVAYVSVMEVASTHPDFRLLQEPDFLHLQTTGQRIMNREYGNYILNLGSSHWRELLFQRIEGLVDEGYDGIFLDTIGNVEFDEFVPERRHEQVRAAAELVKDIRERFPDHLIIQNNGLVELLNETAAWVDGVCWENPPLEQPKGMIKSVKVSNLSERLSRLQSVRTLLLLEEGTGSTTERYEHARKLCGTTRQFLLYRAPSRYLQVEV